VKILNCGKNEGFYVNFATIENVAKDTQNGIAKKVKIWNFSNLKF
jgi:hypothetical protein